MSREVSEPEPGLPNAAPPRTGAAEIVAGLVFAFRVGADGSSTELDVDRPIDLPTHAGEWMWLHFNLVDSRAGRWIGNQSELPPVARTLLVTPHDHQQFYVAGDCVYGVFAGLVRELDRTLDRTAFLHFAMTDTLVVTGRRQSMQAVEETRVALRTGRRLQGPSALLEALVENVATGFDRSLEQLAADLDQVEDMVLGDALHDERKRLGHIRRGAVHLHRQLNGLRALFNRFQRSENAAPALASSMARLAQLLEGLDQEVLALQERARLLQEEIGSKLSEESARSLQTLTILTALFMPPTLIAGVFGMNLRGLLFAESPHGSLWVMLVGALSSFFVYCLLRWLGIIRR